VPAHDSVNFIWDEPQLERHLPGLVFDPAYSMTITVTTSLGRSYSATCPIHDITPPSAEPALAGSPIRPPRVTTLL
jgi:hypothetical protein